MTHNVPERASLERLRKQAKSLQCAAGSQESLGRFWTFARSQAHPKLLVELRRAAEAV